MPIPVITLNLAGLTGGAPTQTVVHSVVGTTANTYGAYTVNAIATPTVKPTLTAATGTLAASQITVGYTFTNAEGETALSPTAFIVADGSHKITVSSITFPTGATGCNIYVSNGGELFLITSQTVAAAFDITDASIAAGSPGVFPPTDDSTSTELGILEYDIATDAAGNVYFGQQAGSEWGQAYLSAPIYVNGDFDTTDLIGLDANALRLLKGRLISGTLTKGVVHIP